MNEDYRRAADLLERRGMAVVDRSTNHWRIRLTALGERIARQMIARNPEAARIFEQLGATIRMDDAAVGTSRG